MQQEKYLFKIWNCHRTKKTALIIPAVENVYEQLILKANQKLQIDGSVLTLESDGTVIDDDEVLRLMCNETFILLQANELWQPNITALPCENPSGSGSTVTVLTSNSSQSSKDILITDTKDTFHNLNATDTSNNQANIKNVLILKTVTGEEFIAEDTYTSLGDDTSQYDSTSHRPATHTCQDITPLNATVPVNTSVVSEDTWRNFEIPWNKLPSNTLAELEAGRRSKLLFKEVTHMICNEMRVIRTDITKKNLRIIVHKILDKYPQTFKDVDDDGVILGDGSHSLMRKLEERNSYLNSLLKRKSSNEVEAPMRKKSKKSSAAKAGCVNWDPVVPSTSEDETRDECVDAMYPKQRAFLNKTPAPTIEDIRQEWPILLTESGIKWHYKKLMGHSVDELTKALKEKSNKIIKYGISKKINVSNFDNAENEQIYIEAIRMAASMLKENLNDLLYTVPDLSSLSQTVATNNPCLVLVPGGEDEDKRYYVCIEKQFINEGSTNFSTALCQCFASYYNFNMQYPKRSSSTLEFIQRYLLKLHPDQGTKSQGFSLSKKKVLTLLKNLAEYELVHTKQ